MLKWKISHFESVDTCINSFRLFSQHKFCVCVREREGEKEGGGRVLKRIWMWVPLSQYLLFLALVHSVLKDQREVEAWADFDLAVSLFCLCCVCVSACLCAQHPLEALNWVGQLPMQSWVSNQTDIRLCLSTFNLALPQWYIVFGLLLYVKRLSEVFILIMMPVLLSQCILLPLVWEVVQCVTCKNALYFLYRTYPLNSLCSTYVQWFPAYIDPPGTRKNCQYITSVSISGEF